MSDYISRQAAQEEIARRDTTDGTVKVFGGREVNEILANLPSAQPEQRWIPCKERLPEDDTLMLVNYIDHRPGAVDVWIGWHEMENVWYIDGEEHSKERGNEVLAWMPLPEPYQAEMKGEKR